MIEGSNSLHEPDWTALRAGAVSTGQAQLVWAKKIFYKPGGVQTNGELFVVDSRPSISNLGQCDHSSMLLEILTEYYGHAATVKRSWSELKLAAFSILQHVRRQKGKSIQETYVNFGITEHEPWLDVE
jgi:hypothetical protein